MSKNNSIYYGNGEIRIECSENILGFDIQFHGNYNIKSEYPENFLIGYNNGRMIGVGLGSILGESPFLKYTGNLSIADCRVTTSDMKILHITPRLIRNDKFAATINSFSGENLKFEDLNSDGVYKGIPNKSTISIITKNLQTSGNQFYLNGENYSGYYHIHHTGVAMTGAEHTEDSKILEIKEEKSRLKNIKRRFNNITTSSIASSTRTGGY